MKTIRKLLLISFFLAIISGVYLFPRTITVKNIICKNQYGQCDEVIINEVNKSLNKKLYLSKKEISIYLNNNHLIKDYSIQYKLGNTLVIDILVEKAKFCLKSSIYDVYSFIDKNGVVLELKSSCNLPIIFVNDKIPNVGEKINNEFLSALNLISQIFISYNIKEGNIIDDYLEVNFNKGYKVIFPLNKDHQILLGSLRLIINRLNSNDSESRIIEDGINVIDLRYENPVLR